MGEGGTDEDGCRTSSRVVCSDTGCDVYPLSDSHGATLQGEGEDMWVLPDRQRLRHRAHSLANKLSVHLEGD